MEDSLSPQGVGRVIMVPVGGVRPEDGEARAAVSDEESEKEGRAMEVDEVEHAPALTSKGKGKARAIEVDDEVDEAPAPQGKGKGKGKEPQGLPAETKETAVKGRRGRAPAAPAAGPSQARVIMPQPAAGPSRLGPATTLPSTLGPWDQLREHAVELAGLNTVTYNCQGDLTNLESKVDRIQDALRHDIYFMQGMMEEYAARNVALEERVRYLEGLAGVEREGEPSQKTEKMVPRDQDARDMETSADELKTAAESDTESLEDEQTRKARWDMDHEEAEKRLLAAVA
ncbi:hypothetical protein C0991_010108, partial [Blastosporella zonata]